MAARPGNHDDHDSPGGGTKDEDSDEYGTLGADAVDFEQYAEVRLENGDVIIYDSENQQAWIQSESAVELDETA